MLPLIKIGGLVFLVMITVKERIDFALKSGIGFGKSAIGIVTGKFESLSQAHNAVKNGGIIDSISEKAVVRLFFLYIYL